MLSRNSVRISNRNNRNMDQGRGSFLKVWKTWMTIVPQFSPQSRAPYKDLRLIFLSIYQKGSDKNGTKPARQSAFNFCLTLFQQNKFDTNSVWYNSKEGEGPAPQNFYKSLFLWVEGAVVGGREGETAVNQRAGQFMRLKLANVYMTGTGTVP